MYKGKKILALICARGGSKGIPGKNIRLLAGQPILGYSIDAAKNCSFVDTVLVSTDDEKIQEVALEYGAKCPFLRPKELSNDTIGRIAAVIHAFQEAEKIFNQKFDVIIDLGNMSPLRNQDDIKNVIKILIDNINTDLVFSVSNASRNPYYNMVEVDSNGYANLCKDCKPQPSCRQMAPHVFDMNDSIYAFNRETLINNPEITLPIQLAKHLRQRIYVMPDERSIDIDREIDFIIVEKILNNQKT